MMVTTIRTAIAFESTQLTHRATQDLCQIHLARMLEHVMIIIIIGQVDNNTHILANVFGVCGPLPVWPGWLMASITIRVC